jgi:acyl carrier protein
MSSSEEKNLAGEIMEIVVNLTGKQVPSTKTDLASVGIDSMAKLDILTALEQKFSVHLGESSFREFVTINRITRVVQDAIRAVNNT